MSLPLALIIGSVAVKGNLIKHQYKVIHRMGVQSDQKSVYFLLATSSGNLTSWPIRLRNRMIRCSFVEKWAKKDRT